MGFAKNTAVTGFGFELKDSAGAAITSGTVTGYVTIDDGTQTTINDTTPTHKGNGQWTVDLTAAEMNGNVVLLLFVHANGTASFTIKTEVLVDLTTLVSAVTEGMVMARTTIATLTSQTQFTITAGPAEANALRDLKIVIIDQSTPTQFAIGRIKSYGTSKDIVLEYDPAIFTMAVGDTVVVMSESGDPHGFWCDVRLDRESGQDEYTGVWKRYSDEVTSGITTPKLQVVRRSDLSTIINDVNMALSGGVVKYDATLSVQRLQPGDACVVRAKATINGLERTSTIMIGRDSI